GVPRHARSLVRRDSQRVGRRLVGGGAARTRTRGHLTSPAFPLSAWRRGGQGRGHGGIVMKLITAVLRTERLQQVKAALFRTGGSRLGGRYVGLRGGAYAQGTHEGYKMRAVFFALWLVAPGVLYAQGASSAPKDTAAAKKPDPPAPPVNQLETTIAGFKLTGFAAGSYAYSGHSLADTTIVGRLYDRFQNRLTLNALAA